MQVLPPAEILDLWEQAEGRHPIDQALALLAAAWPGVPRERLAALPLGRRNVLLLELRQQTLGSRLEGFGRCPRCAEQVEFTVSVTELLSVAPERQITDPESLPEPGEQTLMVDGYELRFRLPDSFDLAAISHCPSPERARELLLQRCLVKAGRDGITLPTGDLPGETVAALAAEMAERDPAAELQLDLGCPACEHRWPVTLDIAAFLWSELADRARSLLDQVHLLARAYGWGEADILALGERRRRHYLERVI